MSLLCYQEQFALFYFNWGILGILLARMDHLRSNDGKTLCKYMLASYNQLCNRPVNHLDYHNHKYCKRFDHKGHILHFVHTWCYHRLAQLKKNKYLKIKSKKPENREIIRLYTFPSSVVPRTGVTLLFLVIEIRNQESNIFFYKFYPNYQVEIKWLKSQILKSELSRLKLTNLWCFPLDSRFISNWVKRELNFHSREHFNGLHGPFGVVRA